MDTEQPNHIWLVTLKKNTTTFNINYTGIDIDGKVVHKTVIDSLKPLES